MKKQMRSLRLGKETLQRLNADQIQARVAAGQQAVGVIAMSQEGASCLDSCYFNTCGAGCVWPTQAGLN